MNYISTYALYNPNDLYLAHYGVKGMKWGVVHDRIKAGGHRTMGRIYGLNERAYNRMGNKTLASMNAAAKKQAWNKANSLDSGYAERVAKRRAAAAKLHRQERARGKSMGRHAVLKTAGRYAVGKVGAIGAGVAAGTGALFLTGGNEKLAKAVAVGVGTAFDAVNTIKAGRNAVDILINTSSNIYEKRQQRRQ